MAAGRRAAEKIQLCSTEETNEGLCKAASEAMPKVLEQSLAAKLESEPDVSERSPAAKLENEKAKQSNGGV